MSYYPNPNLNNEVRQFDPWNITGHGRKPNATRAYALKEASDYVEWARRGLGTAGAARERLKAIKRMRVQPLPG